MIACVIEVIFRIFMHEIRQTLTKGNPTNTNDNPANSKHVCQIIIAVTYCLSDYLACLTDCLS